ncbi:hypothetical protein AB0B25_08080 [Nocardia sp. NPDC049190]
MTRPDEYSTHEPKLRTWFRRPGTGRGFWPRWEHGEVVGFS